MLEAIFSWVFETWYNAFIALLLFFNVLYWSVTGTGILVFRYLVRKRGLTKVANHHLYAGQLRKEIGQSMRSIIVFSLQGILIQQGIKQGWFQISYELN